MKKQRKEREILKNKGWQGKTCFLDRPCHNQCLTRPKTSSRKAAEKGYSGSLSQPLFYYGALPSYPPSFSATCLTG